MADLNKIFEKAGSCRGVRTYKLICKEYKIYLWVGESCGKPYSFPNSINLSLNDYTHYGIDVRNKGFSLARDGNMQRIFGFHFYDIGQNTGNTCFYEFGRMIPKHYLIKILEKIGAISSIPDDAGDGE